MKSLTFSESPTVLFGGNKFINIPVILKYEAENLIEVVKELGVGFETKIPIFHSDGTKLAIVKGNRIYKTEDGKKAGLDFDSQEKITYCNLNGKTIFELRHEIGELFKLDAELYTNDGVFLKSSDSPIPELIDSSGNEIKIGGLSMTGNTFKGGSIGIWINGGNISIGVS